MFLGHFGLGFAGKRVAPSVSLGTLFLAVQWADLMFFILALLGIEHFRIAPGNTRMTPVDFYDYPISHSLVWLIVWGIVVGGLYFAVRKSRLGGLLLAAGVVSHWFLDAFVHRPDMPVLPSGPKVGLGLWNAPAATAAAEALVFGWGIGVYLKTTRAADRTGRWAFWTLVVFLAAAWVASVVGPPPPNERSMEWTGIAMWLFVPWGWWIDRHRTIVSSA